MNHSHKEEISRNTFQPLVSIGIPTYNRHLGLSRTLRCITQQTYSNLEIIISDNASPDVMTEIVARDFMALDPRIQYHRQQENRGSFQNFKFVLECAMGKYFMWAADDDEWDPRFVEVCVHLLENGSVSAMTGFDTLYRRSGVRCSNNLPVILSSSSTSEIFFRFLCRPTPSLFYGVHRRAALQFFIDENQWFDYYDCYFVLRLIIQGHIATWPEVLYTAGIDTPTYQIKPAKLGKGLNLIPFLYATNHLVSSDYFSLEERLKIKAGLVYFGIRGYLWYCSHLFRSALTNKLKKLNTGSYDEASS
jgi:glycosyltransferase involved in cell wall biosynthesis